MLLQILQGNLNNLPQGVSTQAFPLPGFVEWCSGSPIKVTITDSGSRVDGVAPDASVRNDIPLSSFFVYEANESGLLPPGQVYRVKITATATGLFSLTFNQKDANGVVTATTKFSEIPVGAGSIGTLVLSPGFPNAALSLDIDGNGSIGITLPPNQALTPAVANVVFRRVILSLKLNEEIQESLLKKVKAAAAALAEGEFREARNVYRVLLHEVDAQTGKHITLAQAAGIRVIVNHLIQQL